MNFRSFWLRLLWSLLDSENQVLSPGGALERNLTGRCPFFKNLHRPFRKKFAFWYPVSELLNYKNYKNNRKNNNLLFSKTITCCYWTNSHNPFQNFWSIFILRSGFYAEKWYPEKRHVPCRFIWSAPSGFYVRGLIHWSGPSFLFSVMGEEFANISLE